MLTRSGFSFNLSFSRRTSSKTTNYTENQIGKSTSFKVTTHKVTTRSQALLWAELKKIQQELEAFANKSKIERSPSRLPNFNLNNISKIINENDC